MKTILSLLICIFCVSVSFAQNNFYSNPKFSFGNVGTMSRYPDDSVITDNYYYCSPLYRTDKEYSPVSIIDAIGIIEKEIMPDEFVPYRPDYIDSTFSDRLGDSVMIICGGNKYWALIKSIGIYNDWCMGLIPICQLKPIEKMPLADNTSYSNNLIALRKGAYFTGAISRISEPATTSPIAKYYVDSLKTTFSKLNADSLFPDSNVVKTYRDDNSATITFVACCRFRNGAMYFSALYGIVGDSVSSKVLTLLDPAAVGHREWKFHSAFDFDKDGLPEYFISVIGWKNETLGIFTIKNGEWVRMQNAFYHGCDFEE